MRPAFARYREFAPCEALSPYVLSFFSFVPANARAPSPERRVTLDVAFAGNDSFSSPLFADGNVSLAFNFERACSVDGSWRDADPSTAVIGPMSYVGAPRNAVCSEMVGVYFRGGRSTPFVLTPARLLKDRIVALDDLWGRAARSLAAELADGSEDVRVDTLERALLERLGRARERATPVDLPGLAWWVTAERGRLTVERMTAAAGVSRQTLARTFRETVGVTPKLYCMLERFKAGLAYAGRGPRVDWARAAADLGYADQSHMIMEFRRFSSLTPHALASRAWFHPFIERQASRTNTTADPSKSNEDASW